ncbi:hypothetical protein ACWDSD_07600 [Streptomyces spiralis]
MLKKPGTACSSSERVTANSSTVPLAFRASRSSSSHAAPAAASVSVEIAPVHRPVISRMSLTGSTSAFMSWPIAHAM